MRIAANHFLEGAVRRLVRGRGARMPVRRAAVIHFTSGASALSTIDFWNTPAAKGAGAHVVIDRDGTVFQCRAFDRTCGHAGVSRWRDPESGKLFTGLNACSIGIELANAGDDTRIFPKNLRMKAAHRNERDPKWWEVFPAAQIAACRAVVRALVLRYKLDDVTGHDCIAPERKNDPGPAFPMGALRDFCGFSGLPEVFAP